jgi:peptide deformylase
VTRPFIPWPDPRLRRPAAPVAAITDEIRAIWEEMIAAMEAMPGVGLAAPQLGIPLALAVVDASPARGQAIRMANPELIATSAGLHTGEEASPNLPGVSAPVTRPAAVTVRFLNDRGETETRALDGLWATSVQHQIDHLAGRMYVDRLSRIRRDMLMRRATRLR